LQAETLRRAVEMPNRVGLEGAGHRIRYLREYLTLMLVVTRGGGERLIEA